MAGVRKGCRLSLMGCASIEMLRLCVKFSFARQSRRAPADSPLAPGTEGLHHGVQRPDNDRKKNGAAMHSSNCRRSLHCQPGISYSTRHGPGVCETSHFEVA